MKFLDEVKIFLQSGSGGDGCVAFRREKFVPKGGPDGGDGGRGGSVIFVAATNLNTLIDFRYTQHFKAPRGGHGMGSNRSGKAADDLIVRVPVGTEVLDDDTGDVLVDLVTEGQTWHALKGGRGGKGNAHFATATNQAPRYAQPGEPGEEKWVRLRLKLIADIGLLGMPNAGKSTFLATVSNARPKVADYPFTTLHPQLGVVRHYDTDMVIADLPGLIEGASEGLGLGHKFLKHLSRCAGLLHLVDGTSETLVDDYKTIRNELKRYDATLAKLPAVVVLTKADAMTDELIDEAQKALTKAARKKVLVMSAPARLGVDEVLTALTKLVKERRAKEAAAAAEAAASAPAVRIIPAE